jgi:prephenate dehydrogenase
LDRAVSRGLVDERTLDLDHATRDADLIVLAAPALASEQILRKILPALNVPDGPIITDVASVKGNLFRAALETCGRFPSKLILGHPIAGSEKTGADAARADLFNKHRVILTPLSLNNKDSIEIVAGIWREFGAEVVEMSVDDHDEFLSATSHLPHVLAYNLVNVLSGRSDEKKIFDYAAGGLSDFTRIAGSDPTMWRDISLANRKQLLRSIDDFSSDLDHLRLAIEQNDANSLLDIFARAKKTRDSFSKI